MVARPAVRALLPRARRDPIFRASTPHRKRSARTRGAFRRAPRRCGPRHTAKQIRAAAHSMKPQPVALWLRKIQAARDRRRNSRVAWAGRASRPETDTAHFLRIGFARDRVGQVRNPAGMRRRRTTREAGHGEIEAAPEEMHRTAFAAEAGTKFFQDAIGLGENAPEAVGPGAIEVRCVSSCSKGMGFSISLGKWLICTGSWSSSSAFITSR